MIRAACHCGSIRIAAQNAPDWVLDCNCSICRRYGALWAYERDFRSGHSLGLNLVQGHDGLDTYAWGDRALGFCRCRACGCLTHHVVMNEPGQVRGVNARMFVDFDPARVTVYRSDNAHTGWFWTRPDAPIWPGPQAPLPPPGPDDWR